MNTQVWLRAEFAHVYKNQRGWQSLLQRFSKGGGVPKESTEDYVGQLTPHLLGLDDLSAGVWHRAEQIFNVKVQQATA